MKTCRITELYANSRSRQHATWARRQDRTTPTIADEKGPVPLGQAACDEFRCLLRWKLGTFLLAVILCPAFLLSGRDPLARRRAHAAPLRGSCGFGLRGRRFAAQLPPNVGDFFCELRRLVPISDQCSFQEGVVVYAHRPKFIIGSHK